MKRNNLNDFIEDYDENETKRQRLSYDKHKKKHDEISNEIMRRNITLGDVLELDLPIDEYVWFSEYFTILRKMEPNTEEKYKMTNMIYKKYQNLKNVDMKKLNKVKNDSGVENDIVSRILNSEHSDGVKAILYKKYKRYYDNTDRTSDEFTKMMDWIDNVLDIPVSFSPNKLNHSELNMILVTLWKNLNNNTYGLNHVKEKIMEVMCAKLLDPNGKGRILTLVGPPGVGKTTIAVLIAQALNIPFDQISLGSVKDSTVLTGHSSTYIGAVPGLFANILLKSKRLDNVILLDEIDKIQPNTQEGRSISSVLLHVLDRTQNDNFRDLYMPEIHLDLSKILFICAANNLDEIDKVLLDRMTVIELDGYSIAEKIGIVKQHLFPKIYTELGFSAKELTFGDNDIKYMIENKTDMCPGVRDCEKKIYQLCERIALIKYAKDIPFSFNIANIKFPLTITRNIIDKLL